MKILGFDPGLKNLGWGVVVDERLIDCGVLKITGTLPEKLQQIYIEITEIISNVKPDEIALEENFLNLNPKASMHLAMARGVILAAAADFNPVQYSARLIKQSITGNGSASKEQVFNILQKLLGQTFSIATNDASDAVAIALCHYYQRTTYAKLLAG